ncbi:MAG: hypothetical protein V1647_01445, partial [Pseudomonadota bacterium]
MRLFVLITIGFGFVVNGIYAQSPAMMSNLTIGGTLSNAVNNNVPENHDFRNEADFVGYYGKLVGVPEGPNYIKELDPRVDEIEFYPHKAQFGGQVNYHLNKYRGLIINVDADIQGGTRPTYKIDGGLGGVVSPWKNSTEFAGATGFGLMLDARVDKLENATLINCSPRVMAQVGKTDPENCSYVFSASYTPIEFSKVDILFEGKPMSISDIEKMSLCTDFKANIDVDGNIENGDKITFT